MKIDYEDLLNFCAGEALNQWLDALPGTLAAEFTLQKHGRLNEWFNILHALPDIQAGHLDLGDPVIRIGSSKEIQVEQQRALESTLRQLHPWRKGPFEIFGIHIDTEWRSDLKWARLETAIQPLHNRLVLDVGCGSGYHCWRMLGAGAKRVIGIEPTMLYVMQFHAIKYFTHGLAVDVLPLSLEDLPDKLQAFDTVFSMGVMYHRRSPLDHLLKLHSCLKPGGELILETLIIDGQAGKTLLPEGRYAKMRNVWFIPDIPTLKTWLKRCRYSNIKVIDINQTSTREQRSTSWMQFESLQDFLSPENPTLTIEGHPAPLRAIVTATAK